MPRNVNCTLSDIPRRSPRLTWAEIRSISAVPQAVVAGCSQRRGSLPGGPCSSRRSRRTGRSRPIPSTFPGASKFWPTQWTSSTTYTIPRIASFFFVGAKNAITPQLVVYRIHTSRIRNAFMELRGGLKLGRHLLTKAGRGGGKLNALVRGFVSAPTSRPSSPS